MFSALMFAVLGKLTQMGSLSQFVCAGVMGLLGLLIVATPKKTAELYEVSKQNATPLFLDVLGLMGSTILSAGLYVGALAYGFAQQRALGVAMTTSAAFLLKWAFAGTKAAGAPYTGGLVGALIHGSLAALALK